MLIALAGCSDEDAYLDAVLETADTNLLEKYSTEEIIMTGELACARIENGEAFPDGRSPTGIRWFDVWHQAAVHLC
jgi:hypothetical protein